LQCQMDVAPTIWRLQITVGLALRIGFAKTALASEERIPTSFVHQELGLEIPPNLAWKCPFKQTVERKLVLPVDVCFSHQCKLCVERCKQTRSGKTSVRIR
jgi:hypothetical protein